MERKKQPDSVNKKNKAQNSSPYQSLEDLREAGFDVDRYKQLTDIDELIKELLKEFGLQGDESSLNKVKMDLAHFQLFEDGRLFEVAKQGIKEQLKMLATAKRPEDGNLRSIPSKELINLASMMFNMWIGLVTNKIDISQETLSMDNGETLAGEALWTRCVLTTASFYDFAVHRFMDEGMSDDGTHMPGLGQLDLIFLNQNEPQNVPQYVLDAHKLSVFYLLGLMDINILSKLNFMLSAEDFGRFGVNLHRSIYWMHHYETNENIHIRTLALRFVRVFLRKITQAYEANFEAFNAQHRYGPFSNIRLSELALLARRDPSVINKYGEKQVEKIFEHQLGLIMASLGFYVIGTRPGERSVDLLCVCGGSEPLDKMTILVEAKSTSHPYTLPVKDERALIEYVAEVKASLTTLPALRFVLIITHEVQSNIVEKLKRLEVSASIPIRLCLAKDIANFREAIPGIVPVRDLVNIILQSPHVLPSNFFRPLIAKYRGIEEDHASLVRKMLSRASTSTPNISQVPGESDPEPEPKHK